MSSSATGVGMPICFLGAILLILTQKALKYLVMS